MNEQYNEITKKWEKQSRLNINLRAGWKSTSHACLSGYFQDEGGRMKYLPIFNKGDKVKVNDKYPDLKSMKGEVYTILAGPVKICGTWCYFLERIAVAGGIAADALEPEKQTNEEWFCLLPTDEKAKALAKVITEKGHYGYASDFIFQCNYVFWENWLKETHETTETADN